MRHFLSIATLLAMTACNSASNCVNNENTVGDPFDTCDPARPFNEQVFGFNLFADRNVVGPVAHGYHQTVPPLGRKTVDNFLTNLKEPSNFINSTLQGDATAAATSFWRFVLNTTVGFAGIRDFAGENGLKYKDQDFGKTLGSYGIGDGAYVVLPILGPSNVRDTTGKVVDVFLDPVGWVFTTTESVIQDTADGINQRNQNNGVINQFYYQSLDPYTASRAAYLQHQAFQ